MCFPLSYDSTITSRWHRSKKGLGNTTSGCLEKFSLNLLRFLASTLRSSCDFMRAANSSRPSFMLSQFRSGNIHVVVLRERGPVDLRAATRPDGLALEVGEDVCE